MDNENIIEKPNYFAVIVAEVRYDDNLSASEKLMYGELTCLTNKYGYCFSSNAYFSKLYKKDASTISRWLKNLEKQGYITIEYEYEGKQCIRRIIKLSGKVLQNFNRGIEKMQEGYCENAKDNNTRYNNTIYNKSSETKHKHGEYKNVLLTDSEKEKLDEKLGSEKADKVIGYFSELKEMKGYTYKSDYLAILKWGIKAYDDSVSQSNNRHSRPRQLDSSLNESYF